jgi:hypothetical protein
VEPPRFDMPVPDPLALAALQEYDAIPTTNQHHSSSPYSTRTVE